MTATNMCSNFVGLRFTNQVAKLFMQCHLKGRSEQLMQHLHSFLT